MWSKCSSFLGLILAKLSHHTYWALQILSRVFQQHKIRLNRSSDEGEFWILISGICGFQRRYLSIRPSSHFEVVMTFVGFVEMYFLLKFQTDRRTFLAALPLSGGGVWRPIRWLPENLSTLLDLVRRYEQLSCLRVFEIQSFDRR